MDRLVFTTGKPPARLDPARQDIACFAGFVALRTAGDQAAGSVSTGADDAPVAIGSWDEFDERYAWNERLLERGKRSTHCDTLMGLAVQSFFARGGRLCYILRLGDPAPVRATVAERRALVDRYWPSYPPLSPVDRATWRGLGWLFGLPEIALLSLPDLPDLFALPPWVPARSVELSGRLPGFFECADPAGPIERPHLRGVAAPRCDAAGFGAWRECLERIAAQIRRPTNHLREIQLLAAVPLPIDLASVEDAPDAAARVSAARRRQWSEVARVRTAFVQLVYPWLRTNDTGRLPGQLAPPDGLFAGLLAQGALADGAWHSLIHTPVPGVVRVQPVLSRDQLEMELVRRPDRATLREHVSILGPTAGGVRVLSDVTTAPDPSYRPASVNRLVVAILRSARQLGNGLVFANNGKAVWRRLRERLESLLAGFEAEGALAATAREPAFRVRCDRSTMTQADLDAGRLITTVEFAATRPVTRLTVEFVVSDAGRVELRQSEAIERESA